jgi:hypothetical protein
MFVALVWLLKLLAFVALTSGQMHTSRQPSLVGAAVVVKSKKGSS